MVENTSYRSTRWTFASDLAPDELKAKYEAAVPSVPAEAVAALVARGAGWDEMVALVGTAAPFDFVRYHQIEAGALMTLAGHTAPCTVYLMGNHVIAERMFRHEPAVMLYAPLRVVIGAGSDRRAWLTFDQPSDQVASFGTANVTAVGYELDRKLAALLDHLGLDVPAGFTDHHH